jgi:N4-gp56 family major capsid protein
MAGQVWVTDSLGGYMYSDKLSRNLRMAVQPMVKFRQFCDAKDATKARNPEGNMLGKGDTFHWNVYSDVGTQGTTLTETSTMPETTFTITQGTLTVNEYGNSVPYTGKLDDLSEHPVREIIRKVLKNDAKKAYDIGAWTQFDTTPLRVVPADSGTSATAVTLTTNGTTTGTNNLALANTHVKAIVDLMKERNIPAYINDDYCAIAWPSAYRSFKDDLEAIHQYTEQGFQLIHNGEIGRYENCRFVEQTFIPKGGAADSTTHDPNTGTADAWDQGLSDWVFFFGEDTVAEGIVIPEEMRGKIPSDYGRSKGIAWYGLQGFGLTQSAAAQARIVKWDSAV